MIQMLFQKVSCPKVSKNWPIQNGKINLDGPFKCKFSSRISGLRHLWGEEETQVWLKDAMQNEPKRYPKNSPQVKAADEGTLTLGWVNHYYLHRLDKENRSSKLLLPWKGCGKLMMLAGAAISKYRIRTKNQNLFLGGLSLSKPTLLKHEYPTRPSIPSMKMSLQYP